LLAGLLVLPAAPTTSAAKPANPVRIAVLPFKDYAGQPTTRGLGVSFGRLLAAAIGADSVTGRHLQVVERAELRQVLDEKKLEAAGMVDAQTTYVSGRILGVSYFVSGALDALSTKRQQKGALLLKSIVLEAQGTFTVRFISTRTASQVVTFQVDAKVSNKAITLETTDPRKRAEWSSATEEGVLDEMLRHAARETVREIKKQGRLGKLRPIEVLGRVVKVEGRRAWINRGALLGVKPGEHFDVIRPGRPLVDPVTGTILGADETKIDAGEVETVAEQFSVLRVKRGLGRRNDLVRPVATAAGPGLTKPGAAPATAPRAP
jgi:hypothetical protein